MTSSATSLDNAGRFQTRWFVLYSIGTILLLLLCILTAAPLLAWAIMLAVVILAGKYLFSRYYASNRLFTYSFYFVILDLANRFYPLKKRSGKDEPFA